MPLDDLVSAIETIKARIQSHRSDLQASEIRTRMALIDPLLTALGWDTGDPKLVLPEYDLQGKRPDYALLGADGKPAAFVEAKKLGESLSAAHRMQMVNYANMAGVAYAGLTDGDRWELYRVFDQKPIEERRIMDVAIAQKPAYESALQLLQLWRPNMASGQPVPAGEPLFAQGKQTAPDEAVPDKPVPPPLPVAPNPPRGVPLSSYDPQNASKRPAAIRFSDGSTRNVRNWWQLPVFTAEWLWSKGRLTEDKTPLEFTQRTYLVHTEPVHHSGMKFGNPKKINGSPFFLEATGQRSHLVKKAKRLLELCGVDPAEVRVQE